MKTIPLKKILCAVSVMFVVLSVLDASASERAFENAKQTFSREELAQMLAPIALYPDPLLSQILMAATYPFEVVEAERWVTKNPFLKKEALDEALREKDWDVSVLALCHYPKVLTMLSENLSWTARIGDAFANQEEDVLDTVQELRARARAAGNLATSQEQRVVVEDRYIRIEPVRPDYLYVPAYDPYVVYGRWWLPLYPPFMILLPGLVLTGGAIVFSPPFYVEYGVFGWSAFNWGIRKIVIVDIDRTRRFHRHHAERRWSERVHWRPDPERRYLREKRSGEIPRFVPPVRSRPQEVRPADRRPAPEGRPSDGGIGRDRRPRWNQPEAEKSKGMDGPKGHETTGNRPETVDRYGADKEKTPEKPRVTDRDKMKVPEQGMNRPPIGRDRGREEGGGKPRLIEREPGKVSEQKTGRSPVIRDRDIDDAQDHRGKTSTTNPKSIRDEENVRGNRDGAPRESPRMEPRQDKGERQDRARERFEDRQEPRDRGGATRDRGDRR